MSQKRPCESFDKRDINNKKSETSKHEEIVGNVVTSSLFSTPIWHKIDQIEQELSVELSKVTFPKEVAAVYNPLIYARALHCEFMSKFLTGPVKVLFVGMNPGPFGMIQTGVPFGYVPTVKNWLKLTSDIEKPSYEIAARPVEGLNCTKEEQSGKRWWGVIQDICGTPETFFNHSFVYNYCPLAFFGATGRNITPAEIKGASKGQLQEICNTYFIPVIDVLKPKIIISIGKYAHDRVKDLQKKSLIDTSIDHKCIPHPSPRSLNNTDWPAKARIWFQENGLMTYLQNN